MDFTGVVNWNSVPVPESVLSTDEMFSLVKADLSGNLWILSNDNAGIGVTKHFYKLDKNKIWTKFQFPDFDGVNKEIFTTKDFAVDENGKLWFIDSYYGVFVFDSKTTSVEENTE